MSYPPGGPIGPGEHEVPQQQPVQPPQYAMPQYPGQPQQPDMAAYGPPTQQQYPVDPVNPYGQAQEPQAPQQPYYADPQQNPYPYAAQDPYAQGQQPYGYQYQYQYDPNAGGYGQPMPLQPPNDRSRNAMIGALVAAAVVAMGVSIYWFGFHDKSSNTTPIGLSSTLTTTTPGPTGSPSATSSDQASASASASATGALGTGDTVQQLQALMATMTDPGCRGSFQALITFEQAIGADAGNDTALVTDYDTAIASLNAAQLQAQDSTKADAIGQLVTDWRSLVSQFAAGGTPDDTTIATDVQQLTATCLD